MILQIMQDLISRLEVRDRNPKTVIAGNALSLDPGIEDDNVILPLSLYDKLTPAEWKPLIASKLIYHRNFTKKKMLVALSYQLFPYLTILFLAPLSILRIIPLLPQPAAAGIILLLVIAMYPVAKVVYAPFFRRLQQTADKQTLELFLTPSLEGVLKKIEAMNPQKPRQRKVVQERIRNLQRH